MVPWAGLFDRSVTTNPGATSILLKQGTAHRCYTTSMISTDRHLGPNPRVGLGRLRAEGGRDRRGSFHHIRPIPMGGPVEGSGQRTVLVVEDDADVREYMVRALTLAGYPVLATWNGHEALGLLAKLGTTAILAVVSDFGMPRVDGVALADQIAKRWPTIPFLMVSGRPPGNWEGPFLAKPFSPNDLITAVEHLEPPAGTH